MAEAREPLGEGPPRVHAASPLLRPSGGDKRRLQVGRHSGTGGGISGEDCGREDDWLKKENQSSVEIQTEDNRRRSYMYDSARLQSGSEKGCSKCREVK